MGPADLGYVPCGEACPECGNGECTKSGGHAVLAGHFSALRAGGCGHRW